MRNLIVVLMAVAVVIIGAYLFMFKRTEVVRAAKGYKNAETPQVAADMFKKAIENRDYDMAAHYCTADYAEQLRRGAKSASDMGEAMDDLTYQLKEHALMRDEVKIVLHALDPFPKEIQITVSKENGDNAEAAIVFTQPLLTAQPTSGVWALKPEIYQVYTRSMRFVNPTTVGVAMKKESSVWKFDFPSDPALQARVAYINDKHKNYINPMRVVTKEVKNDPSTKENTTKRLKQLLEEAAGE